ncbi:hypothetical protein SCALM49S_03486 [Streptomyces californicus]
MTPCLSGQTPVEIVDQPGPEEVAAIGSAYSSEVPYVPFAIIAFRCGALAAVIVVAEPVHADDEHLVLAGAVREGRAAAARAGEAVASGETAAAVAAAAVVARTERRDRDRVHVFLHGGGQVDGART